MVRTLKRHRYTLLFVLLLSAGVLWRETGREASSKLRVHFLNVGQGDATFIEAPSGQQVLIDGGPKQTVVRELARIMPFWDRSIDLVVLTHPQLDHLSGLVGILERYRIERLMLNGAAYQLAAYETLLRMAEKKQIPVVLARAGEVFKLGDGATATVLNPTDAVIEYATSRTLNETSVVLRLDYGKTSFLFTGDAGFPTEERLQQTAANLLDVDILKVGHHGSKHASSEAFLEITTPHVAVIEVGSDNTYGHPTPETLSRLASVGAVVFRTDTDSTVTITTDGASVLRHMPPRCPLFCRAQAQPLFAE